MYRVMFLHSLLRTSKHSENGAPKLSSDFGGIYITGCRTFLASLTNFLNWVTILSLGPCVSTPSYSLTELYRFPYMPTEH